MPMTKNVVHPFHRSDFLGSSFPFRYPSKKPVLNEFWSDTSDSLLESAWSTLSASCWGGSLCLHFWKRKKEKLNLKWKKYNPHFGILSNFYGILVSPTKSHKHKNCNYNDSSRECCHNYCNWKGLHCIIAARLMFNCIPHENGLECNVLHICYPDCKQLQQNTPHG